MTFFFVETTRKIGYSINLYIEIFMFIRFSVQNFKSFNDTAVWSAVADEEISVHQKKLRPVAGINLLSNIAIYGPNSSGKTSLISAVKFLKDWLKHGKGLKPFHKKYYCRVDENNANKVTRFFFQFEKDGCIYAYDVAVILHSATIEYEKLYLREKGTSSSIMLFERNHANGGVLGDSFKQSLNEKELAKWEVYLSDFNFKESRLFLGYFVREKNFNDAQFQRLRHFYDAYTYMTDQVAVISPNEVYVDGAAPYEIIKNTEFVNFLARFDTGITDLKIVEVDQDEELKEMSRGAREYLKREFEESYIKEKNDVKMVCRSHNGILIFEFGKNEEIICKTLKTAHVGATSLFDFKEESDGTKRLFDLMGMLLSAKQDKVYIIDEIDRSMHSQLTAAFIRSFNQVNENKRCQLFFTTHDTTLLDEDLLRRDEVYFVERNKESSSKLYSMDDFPEWKRGSIADAYRQGRYGALPLITDIEDCSCI